MQRNLIIRLTLGLVILTGFLDFSTNFLYAQVAVQWQPAEFTVREAKIGSRHFAKVAVENTTDKQLLLTQVALYELTSAGERMEIATGSQALSDNGYLNLAIPKFKDGKFVLAANSSAVLDAELVLGESLAGDHTFILALAEGDSEASKKVLDGVVEVTFKLKGIEASRVLSSGSIDSSAASNNLAANTTGIVFAAVVGLIALIGGSYVGLAVLKRR